MLHRPRPSRPCHRNWGLDVSHMYTNIMHSHKSTPQSASRAAARRRQARSRGSLPRAVLRQGFCRQGTGSMNRLSILAPDFADESRITPSVIEAVKEVCGVDLVDRLLGYAPGRRLEDMTQGLRRMNVGAAQYHEGEALVDASGLQTTYVNRRQRVDRVLRGRPVELGPYLDDPRRRESSGSQAAQPVRPHPEGFRQLQSTDRPQA